MAEKKSKKIAEDKTKEVKENVMVEEPKTDDKEKTENKKVEEVKTNKDDEVEKEKIEDESVDSAEMIDKKTEETKEGKNDTETENTDEKKDDTEKQEKKPINKKALNNKEDEKENNEEKKLSADENKDGYVSAREVVNSIDEDVKIVEKSEDEILANHVAEQLRENQDYFIFRIRKSLALWIAGLTVVLLWMIPLSSFVKNSFNLSGFLNKIKNKESSEQVASPTPSPTPELEKLNTDRIRIKINKETEKVASISSLLKDSGYSEVDILEAEVKEDGINVAVKKGSDELREKLMLILKDEYSAGSSSSELTDDSDFSAVILIGK